MSCHFATTDAEPLLKAAIAKAGSARKLAPILGTTHESLSRARHRGELGGPSSSTKVVLPQQVRFDMVQYLLDQPIFPPPPAGGQRARLAVDVITVWVDDATHEALRGMAWQKSSIRAMAAAALDRFRLRYCIKPRSMWPAPALEPGPHVHTISVDRAVVEAFDLAIGGPGWRRFYAPVAFAEYLAEQEAAKPPGSAKPARANKAG